MSPTLPPVPPTTTQSPITSQSPTTLKPSMSPVNDSELVGGNTESDSMGIIIGAVAGFISICAIIVAFIFWKKKKEKNKINQKNIATVSSVKSDSNNKPGPTLGKKMGELARITSNSGGMIESPSGADKNINVMFEGNTNVTNNSKISKINQNNINMANQNQNKNNNYYGNNSNHNNTYNDNYNHYNTNNNQKNIGNMNYNHNTQNTQNIQKSTINNNEYITPRGDEMIELATGVNVKADVNLSSQNTAAIGSGGMIGGNTLAQGYYQDSSSSDDAAADAGGGGVINAEEGAGDPS